MLAAQRAFEGGDWETAVSRAYYAAYHSIVAVLEVRGRVGRERWDHVQVQNEFRARFTNRGFLFNSRDARALADLYEARIDADYTTKSWRRSAAEVLISRARELCNHAREVI
jgi:uncharacterized protein (UPF0332 family)